MEEWSNTHIDMPENTEHPDYAAEITAILRSGLTPGLMRERIIGYHENDLAAALELLSPKERQQLYAMLDHVMLASILEYSGSLNEYLKELGLKKRIAVLSELEAATAAECLKSMEKADRTTLLELLDADVRKEILLLSSFDEDEIGSWMTTNFISVQAGITIRETMKQLVSQAAENDNIGTIYVLDDETRFLGAIDLKDLIIARENKTLSEITKTSYPYVYADELIEDCMERIKEYSEDSIPVLDRDNRLLGVLISQDITLLVD